MSRKAHSHSPWTLDALRVLGQQVSSERRTLRWTQAELAERAGITAKTLSGIESGSPSVAIGTVFEVAALLGIPLVGAADPMAKDVMAQRLALLPARVDHPRREVEDDF